MRPSDSLTSVGHSAPVPLAFGLPRGGCLVLGRTPACTRKTQDRWRFRFGSPWAVASLGDVRASQVTGPSSSYVPETNTPPGPRRPTRRIASVSSSAPMKAWTSGGYDLFEADSSGPHARVPTHRRCCCCQRRKARYRPVGLYFDRVGFAPTGRRSGFQGVIVTSHPTRPALPGRTIGRILKDPEIA